jgi:DNA-directed RNA polymerase specialized sigma24 family protein
MSTTTLFDLLEREWPQLEGSHGANRALKKWGSEDGDLAPFSSVEDLMAPAGSPRHRAGDAALAALVRRAASDDLAARVLLQLLLPGLKDLARRYRWMGEPEEVAAVVVVAAYERIRTYPIERRPVRIAANVVEDTRQHLWRRAKREDSSWGTPSEEGWATPFLRGSANFEAGTLEQSDDYQAGNPGGLPELLEWALAEGHLSADAVELLLLTRAHEVPIAELCQRSGESPQTVRRRRLRAENRLRAAVAAAA